MAGGRRGSCALFAAGIPGICLLKCLSAWPLPGTQARRSNNARIHFFLAGANIVIPALWRLYFGSFPGRRTGVCFHSAGHVRRLQSSTQSETFTLLNTRERTDELQAAGCSGPGSQAARQASGHAVRLMCWLSCSPKRMHGTEGIATQQRCRRKHAQDDNRY